MFVSVVLAPICLLIVGASHWETCEDVIARERDEDWRYHSKFESDAILLMYVVVVVLQMIFGRS